MAIRRVKPARPKGFLRLYNRERQRPETRKLREEASIAKERQNLKVILEKGGIVKNVGINLNDEHVVKIIDTMARENAKRNGHK